MKQNAVLNVPQSPDVEGPESGNSSRDAAGVNDNLVIRIQRWVVLMFQLVRAHAFGCFRRSRGSVEERPVHTGKVAGSIPAGTTRRTPWQQGVLFVLRRAKRGAVAPTWALAVYGAVW